MNTERTERFVDEAEKPIPPRTTWEELTLSELIDVKNLLEEKLYAFGNNPVISKGIKAGLTHLDKLLQARLA